MTVHRRALALTGAAALALACRGPHPAANASRPWPSGELRSGGAPISAALRPGEVHRYRLPLQKGQWLRLVVDQQGIDVAVAFEDPTGARVLEADRLIEDRGPELVLAVTRTDGPHTLVIRGPSEGSPGRYAARVEELRPATAADRRSAEAYRILTGAKDLKPAAAMERCQRALTAWQDPGDVALQAEALLCIARQQIALGDYQQAAGSYGEAVSGFARSGDHRQEAIARNELGSCLLPLGEAQEAADQNARALAEARREGDRLLAAKSFHSLGQAFQDQGELQTALDREQQALALWPKGDRHLRPYTLHNLGVLYAHAFHDQRRGEALLLQAKNAWLPEDQAWKARTLRQLGRVAYEEGRLEEAHRYFADALKLRRDTDPCGSAVLLAASAVVGQEMGQRPKADEQLTAALQTVGTKSCLRSQPAVHLLAGSLAERRGEPAKAHTQYQQSQALFASQGDRLGVAESLEGLARSSRALGDLPAALAASERALEIFEGVRPKVLGEDLRTSFFSGSRDAFDFHVDLLLEMGRKEEAWAAAERARARTLGDLLAESGAGLRRSVDPVLAAREQDLQRRLNALESQRQAVSDARATKLRLRQSLGEVLAELESTRGEIRRRSPRYASLIRPEPVSLPEVRRELLDDDTVLLEYRLGETAGTVWAVTAKELITARLPPRRDVEGLAQEAASWTRAVDRTGENPPALCELSRMLLAPVQSQLGHRRLVVVADGALATLSFAALPDPADLASCPAAPPLVESHEIAYLPSATTLLTQRSLLARRQPAPGWMAVVADPVYAPPVSRLRGSAEEAKAVVAGLPSGKFRVDTGFAASRQTVTGGALHAFRILHFAVHGTLDAEQPLLSALLLSQLDSTGRPLAGVLAAHEIYDLDLPAELVVLSACETALGREVAGEGLVSGLPRAFLYAGAARVVVSLWPVEDQSTRDLMAIFYRGLFERHLAPAQALQEAQRNLRRAGRLPFQWAGFVLQGDWKPLPPFSP
jgi:CHAT domain-containing protein